MSYIQAVVKIVFKKKYLKLIGYHALLTLPAISQIHYWSFDTSVDIINQLVLDAF